MSSLIFVVVLTFFQTFMLQVAYKNVKFVKKDQFATQRTQAITKEIQVRMADLRFFVIVNFSNFEIFSHQKKIIKHNSKLHMIWAIIWYEYQMRRVISYDHSPKSSIESQSHPETGLVGLVHLAKRGGWRIFLFSL